MPILEALVTLGFVGRRHGAGDACRPRCWCSRSARPLLVAKQVSTLDTLSGGRMRLGVGVGWQEAEYEALGEDFARRGTVMDEAIGLLRACWGDERIELRGERFDADAIAMEPKPPQGGRLPVWIGGTGARRAAPRRHRR